MANSVINFPGARGTSPVVLLYQQHLVTNSCIAYAGNTGSFTCDSDNALRYSSKCLSYLVYFKYYIQRSIREQI